MAHTFVEREGRRLHAAACWCWHGTSTPQLGRLAPASWNPAHTYQPSAVAPAPSWWRRLLSS